MTSSPEKANIGLLLVNLGSPEAPTPEAVKPYLSEFLMDPDVIDIPAILRWPLVHWVIVPKRSKASAELYKKIWTQNGSPLLHYSRIFAEALRHELLDRSSLRIELAMRYGNPGIREGLERLRLKELDRLIVFPLYPQYAQSSTLTVQKKVQQVLDQLGISTPKPEWIPPFYADSGFIEAERTVASGPLESFNPDFSLFSFHGLPERHVKRLHTVCLSRESCCDRVSEENRNCYRAQCFNTARTIAEALKIPRDKYSVSFQSRLGRTPWIQPFTDVVIQELPQRGVQRLAVFCPSFVADCLETLDEIENRERDRFLKAGGKELQLVPSLNENPVWVRAAAEIVKRTLDRSR
jgi:ferrochelatase